MMEQIIGTPSHNVWDKVKNVVFAYAIMTVWVFSVTAVLNYLAGVDGQFYVDPKYTFFMSCIWAPVWEEALFRFMPITIAKAIDPKLIFPVVMISSGIFGWGHGYGPVSLLIQGVMGLVLSAVYLKNGNLIYSIILHSAWNTSCMFLFPRIS